jgi:hypothetical protein
MVLRLSCCWVSFELQPSTNNYLFTHLQMLLRADNSKTATKPNSIPSVYIQSLPLLNIDPFQFRSDDFDMVIFTVNFLSG